MKHNYIFYLLVSMMTFLSCQSDQAKNTNDIWKNTTKHQLLGEVATIKIPSKFKRSSRFRLKDDVPYFEKDAFLLKYFQHQLENKQFKDEKIDVFVDTTAVVRLFSVLDREPIPLNKQALTLFNHQMKKSFERLNLADLFIETKKMEAFSKKTSDKVLIKIKYAIHNKLQDISHYQTVFVMTTAYRTVFVTEFSDNTEDIENYLWSLKK